MICVDANVVVALILNNRYSAQAAALLDEQHRTIERVIAVDLLGYEVTNAVHQHARSGLPFGQARERLALLPGFGIEMHSAAGLHDRALTIARETGIRATYDTHYVALAEAVRCDLWTADRRLVTATQPRYPFVRYLADFRIA